MTIKADIDVRRADQGLCVVCGRPKRRNALTCRNEDCHEKFVSWCEEQFGAYKRVMGPDGVTRRVPTRDIIEKGIKTAELEHYPVFGEVKSK